MIETSENETELELFEKIETEVDRALNLTADYKKGRETIYSAFDSCLTKSKNELCQLQIVLENHNKIIDNMFAGEKINKVIPEFTTDEVEKIFGCTFPIKDHTVFLNWNDKLNLKENDELYNEKFTPALVCDFKFYLYYVLLIFIYIIFYFTLTTDFFDVKISKRSNRS